MLSAPLQASVTLLEATTPVKLPTRHCPPPSFMGFRTCSTCWSHSQAPLCLYTLRTISKRAEGTLGRLRYSLGGDRPSQTARQTLSFARIHGTKLGSSFNQGGIPRLTPPRLTSQLQSLPPILYRLKLNPISTCSKGARGLSVLMRVTSIFTGITTSPGLPLRLSEVEIAVKMRRSRGKTERPREPLLQLYAEL